MGCGERLPYKKLRFCRMRNCPRRDLLQLWVELAVSYFNIVGYLGTKPKALGKAEELAKAKIGVGRDGATPQNNLPNALSGNARFLGETILGYAHGDKEIFFEYFTWSNRVKIFGHSSLLKNDNQRSPRLLHPCLSNESRF